MSDTRSPLERMIDDACGIKPGEVIGRGLTIEMECSVCGKRKTAGRDKTDPKGAVLIKFPCPTCWPNTDVAPFCGPQGELRAMFYDADGNEVTPSWEAEG